MCLYFEHFKKPRPNTGRVSAHWRSKEDFAKDGAPQLFFELFPEYSKLVQGKWDTAEQFEYRFAVNKDDGLFGCTARFRTGLFIAGFAITDISRVTETLDNDWIPPNQLFDDHDHFYLKN